MACEFQHSNTLQTYNNWDPFWQWITDDSLGYYSAMVQEYETEKLLHIGLTSEASFRC